MSTMGFETIGFVNSKKLGVSIGEKSLVKALEHFGIHESKYHETVISVIESDDGTEVINYAMGDLTCQVSLKKIVQILILKEPTLRMLSKEEEVSIWPAESKA